MALQALDKSDNAALNGEVLEGINQAFIETPALKDFDVSLGKLSAAESQGASKAGVFAKMDAQRAAAVQKWPDKIAEIDTIYQKRLGGTPAQLAYKAEQDRLTLQAAQHQKYIDKGIEFAGVHDVIEVDPKTGQFDPEASARAGYNYENMLRLAKDHSNPNSPTAVISLIQGEVSPSKLAVNMQTLGADPEAGSQLMASNFANWMGRAQSFRAIANSWPEGMEGERTKVLDQIDSTTKFYQDLSGLKGPDAVSVMDALVKQKALMEKIGLVQNLPKHLQGVGSIAIQSPDLTTSMLSNKVANLLGETNSGDKTLSPNYNPFTSKVAQADLTTKERQNQAAVHLGTAQSLNEKGAVLTGEGAQLFTKTFVEVGFNELGTGEGNSRVVLDAYLSKVVAQTMFNGASTPEDKAAVSGRVSAMVNQTNSTNISTLSTMPGLGTDYEVDYVDGRLQVVDIEGNPIDKSFQNAIPSLSGAYIGGVIASASNAYQKYKATEVVDKVHKDVRKYVELYGETDPALKGLSAQDAYDAKMAQVIDSATNGRGFTTSETLSTKGIKGLATLTAKTAKVLTPDMEALKNSQKGPEATPISDTFNDWVGSGTKEDPIKFFNSKGN
jgi:hypothetical protein